MAANLMAPPTPEELEATAGLDHAAPTAEELAATEHVDKADPNADLNFVQRGVLATMHGIGTAGRYVNSIAFDPLKSAVKTYIDTGDAHKAEKAGQDKFGSPNSPQVSGTDILESMGVPNDRSKGFNTGLKMGPTDIVRPTVLVKDLYEALGRKMRGENDPEAMTMTPANVGGAAIDAATDPLMYAPTIAGRAMGALGGAEGIGAKAASIAEERAVKAGTGQNIAALRRAARVSPQGSRSPTQAMNNVRGVGRQLLDNNAVGWFSNPESVGARVEPLLKESGDRFDSMAKAVDARNPQGVVSGQDIADRTLDYGSSFPSMKETEGIQSGALDRAAEYEKLQNMTIQDAQARKNQYKFKPTAPGAFESNQDAINKMRGIVGQSMDEAMQKQPEGAAWMAEKKPYGAYVNIAEASTDRTLKNLSNRYASPSDYLAGAGGALKGEIEGKGGLLSGIYGLAAAAINKQVRTRGSAFAARSLDGIAKGLETYDNLPKATQTLLEQAAKRSANAVIWTHEQLMKTDPDYRAHFEGQQQ